MNAAELDAILVTARSAAREAATFVHGGFRKHPVVEHKGVVDLVRASIATARRSCVSA